MVERQEQIEGFKQRSAQASEQAIRENIQGGRYGEAKERVEAADLPQESMDRIEGEIDEKTGEQTRETLTKANETIDEMVEAIDKAQERITWGELAKPTSLFFTLLGPALGTINKLRFKSTLKDIERLQAKVGKLQGAGGEKTKAENVGSQGYLATAGSTGMAAGSVYLAPATGGVSLLGIIPAAIMRVYGIFRLFGSMSKLGTSKEQLDDLRKKAMAAKNENLVVLSRLGAPK